MTFEWTLTQLITGILKWALYAVVGVGAWLCRNFLVRIDKLEQENINLKVKLAEEYVKKDDFEKLTDRIMEKLDLIRDRLDQKVDRS
jgi:hypothetical protein